MPELAYNLIWSWEPIIRALFRRLDPNLWRECGYNPVLMLGRVPQATLERVAADPRYLALYRMACQRFDAHVLREEPNPEGKLIAYFSAEYGLTECLPDLLGRPGRPLRRPPEVLERFELSRWSASACSISRATSASC